MILEITDARTHLRGADPGNQVPPTSSNPKFDFLRVEYNHLEYYYVRSITSCCVSNYPASSFITMTHPTNRIPRGDPNRVRQLQNLMHGAGGRDPIMGSGGFYVNPNTSAQLDYGLPALAEESYAEGGAPVAQDLDHPQRQVGQWLGVQEELANELDVPDDMAENRKYGFDCTNIPPFVNAAGEAYPNTLPVIRVENIPFGISYNEIISFMEKHLMPRHGGVKRNYPVHIFMERANAKSQDAWLELPDQETHDHVMKVYNDAIADHKPFKMTTRVIDITSSSQGEFMASIFPSAKNIHWDPETGIPIMVKLDDCDPYSTGFKGFLSKEELHIVRMHMDHPIRAPFPAKGLPRCFESMITTLLKYPWASPYFKAAERDDIFKTYEKMLEVLAGRVLDAAQIEAQGRIIGLHQKLCINFVNVGLRCPGFSERQKYRISEMMQEYGMNVGISHLSKMWPCQTLGIPAEVNDDDLESWLDLFDKGALLTDLYPNTYGSSVGKLVELGRDDSEVWVMEDISAQFLAIGDPKAEAITYADLADAEQILLTALLSRGWERFFAERHLEMDDNFKIPEPEASVTKNKMKLLGVYKSGGVDRPKKPQAGDDIVYVAPEDRGTWQHLMTSNTSTMPVKSLTEVLASIGIEADPKDELEFQRIQAEIHGEPETSEDESSAGGMVFSPTQRNEVVVQTTEPQWLDRSNNVRMHSQGAPSTRGRSYSSVVSNVAQERTPQGRTTAAVLASRAAGTYSVPQRRRMSMLSPDEGQGIDFGSISRQAIATKSKEATPMGSVSSSASVDPFGPASGRDASPDRAGRSSQAFSSLLRRRSQSPAKYDPFGPSSARAGADTDTPRGGRTDESTPATTRRRSKSPAKMGCFGARAVEATPTNNISRVGRVNEPGSSIARRRSKSPSKVTYVLTIKPPVWGGLPKIATQDPIGTPSRRGTVTNTIGSGSGSGIPVRRGTVTSSPTTALGTPTRRGTVTNTGVDPSILPRTLPEGDNIEDWPTPGRASRTGGRSRR